MHGETMKFVRNNEARCTYVTIFSATSFRTPHPPEEFAEVITYLLRSSRKVSFIFDIDHDLTGLTAVAKKNPQYSG